MPSTMQNELRPCGRLANGTPLRSILHSPGSRENIKPPLAWTQAARRLSVCGVVRLFDIGRDAAAFADLVALIECPLSNRTRLLRITLG